MVEDCPHFLASHDMWDDMALHDSLTRLVMPILWVCELERDKAPVRGHTVNNTTRY